MDFDILTFADSMAPGLTICAIMIKLEVFIRQHRDFWELLTELESFMKKGKFF